MNEIIKWYPTKSGLIQEQFSLSRCPSAKQLVQLLKKDHHYDHHYCRVVLSRRMNTMLAERGKKRGSRGSRKEMIRLP